MTRSPLVTAAPDGSSVSVRISLKRAAGEAAMSPRAFLKHLRIAESEGWLALHRFSDDEYGVTPMIPEGFEHGAA